MVGLVKRKGRVRLQARAVVGLDRKESAGVGKKRRAVERRTECEAGRIVHRERRSRSGSGDRVGFRAGRLARHAQMAAEERRARAVRIGRRAQQQVSAVDVAQRDPAADVGKDAGIGRESRCGSTGGRVGRVRRGKATVRIASPGGRDALLILADERDEQREQGVEVIVVQRKVHFGRVGPIPRERDRAAILGARRDVEVALELRLELIHELDEAADRIQMRRGIQRYAPAGDVRRQDGIERRRVVEIVGAQVAFLEQRLEDLEGLRGRFGQRCAVLRRTGDVDQTGELAERDVAAVGRVAGKLEHDPLVVVHGNVRER